MIPKVSVIVPVYNVEQYIDQCLKSIVEQSYGNLEILIMEGESTDQSLMICKKWEKIDPRITVVSRKDGGLGPARNYGIKMAQGEFLFFVDSDDYLSKDAIKNLITKTYEDKVVDIVAGGYRNFDENNVKQEYFLPKELGCDEVVQSKASRKKYMRRGHVAVWGKLYRTSFIKSNHIQMPVGAAEDLAVFPILVCKAKKIICVNEIVYFYRKERKDSGSNNILVTIPMYKSIDIYCNYLKETDDFEIYRNELFFLSRIHLTTWLDLFKKQLSVTEYQEVEKKYIKKLDEYFGKDSLKKNTSIFPIGSYNVRFECKQVQGYEVTGRHHPFTSTIAQFFDDQICNGKFHHVNRFRNECLLHDKEKTVKKCLDNPQFMFNEVVFDFMDDVNGIVCLSDGSIMSKTEVFEQSDREGIEIREVISIENILYWEMWKKACLNFVYYIEKSNSKIILVKNRYTEQYNDENGMHDFERIKEINKKNLYIERMEEYFLKNCSQNVHVVDVDIKKRYSDRYFMYGCSEEYLGASGKNDVAEKILDIINIK